MAAASIDWPRIWGPKCYACALKPSLSAKGKNIFGPMCLRSRPTLYKLLCGAACPAVSRKVSAVKCGIGFMPDPIYCWTRYAKMPAMNMSPQTGNQPNNSFFQRILEKK